MEHWHADVTENGCYIQGGSKCFYGKSGEGEVNETLEAAQSWLGEEIGHEGRIYGMDSEEVGDQYGELRYSCETWPGDTEAWEGEVSVSTHGGHATRGYRLMEIDGACTETMDL